jgi:hypothetical protein
MVAPRCFPLSLSSLFALSLLTACNKQEWIPQGSWQRPLTPECSLEKLQITLLASGDSLATQKTEVARYLHDCEQTLHVRKRISIGDFARLFGITYDYAQLPRVVPVEIHERNGNILQGRLGLQPGDEPRPLVIMKCGLQCDLDDPAAIYQFMWLFDESPFHVLLLPSTMAKSYPKLNREMVLGGFYEGQQVFHAAEYVRSDAFPYRHLVSSVHASGFSLGGAATLYASLVSSQNRLANGNPLIESYFVGCPPVDIETSTRNLYRNSLMGIIARRSLYDQIGDIWDAVPVLGQLFPSNQLPPFKQIPDLLAKSSLGPYRILTRDPSLLLPPFRGIRVENLEDFWRVNDFRNFTDFEQQDVFIWSALDDPMVGTRDNTIKLMEHLEAHPNPHIEAVVTPFGSHCLFGEPYGWKTAGTILRSILLSRMPELLAKRHVVTEAIPDVVAPLNGPRAAIADHALAFRWRITRQSPNVELWSAVTGPRCRGREVCEESLYSFIPLAKLRIPGLASPANDQSAQALTRWLNANILLLNKEWEPVSGYESPAYYRWTSFQ